MIVSQLPDFVDGIISYLKDQSAATGVANVVRLYAGELGKLVSPSIGVFLGVPEPDDKSRMVSGDSVLDDWRIVIVIVSETTASKEAGFLYCFDKVSMIKELIEFHPTREFARMQLDTPAYSVLQNTDKQSCVAIHYTINCPV